MSCQFCQENAAKNDCLSNKRGFFVEINALEKELNITFEDERTYLYKELDIPIRYCSQCGRNLYDEKQIKE